MIPAMMGGTATWTDQMASRPMSISYVDERYPFEDVTGLVNDVGSIFTGLVDHGNH